ncbi:MAG TPA: BTAD domain-containing putative transcriptional regulator [Chthonomonadaceae bacterium]|nr:BTAD domain-containing putative transcriptional regulator [Chthonomonadaceae bacterium]
MNTPYRIELLGGLCVRNGERVLTRFQTQKTGCLLACLAYYLHRVHPREELLERLWPEVEPTAGRNRLKQALASLRRQLEPPGTPAGSVLIADRASIRLHAQAVTTDVAKFQALIQTASRIADLDGRIQQLTQAVELYRGELLPGFYEDWILTERQRLADAYLGALRQLVAALQQAGELERAIDYAHRAVAADPWQEEASADLMRLYAAAGRPAEALREYDRLKRLLHTELNAIPSSTLCELAERLRQNLPGPPPSPVSPPPRKPEREASPILSSSPRSPVPRLPLTFTRFFGRHQEMERLLALLSPSASPRLLTLTGPGGCGKTRLAIEVARKLVEAFGGAIWFVPLADLSEARMIPGEIADALGLTRSPTREPLEQVIEALSRQPALLLLDNYEHLVEAGAFLVRTLLEQVPTLTCLVTSRHPLDLEGEQECVVMPLPIPEAPETPERLMEVASVALFVDRAQARQADFTVTAANAAAVAAVCGRLEGIPLAIELAAGWARTLTPAQMLAHLSQRFDLLVSRRKDVSPRHLSLRAALEWSYRLLSPELQRFFARLSVFRGGWTEAAAVQVCQEPLARKYLAQLRDHSLILAEEQHGTMRFRMLETLREFGQEQLSAEEQTALRRCHLAYFLELAETAEPQLSGAEQVAWFHRLETERDNLRTALTWCLHSTDIEAGLRLGASLWQFWSTHNYAEGLQWLRQFLARSREASASARARALNAEGSLAGLQGDMIAAQPLFEESLRLFRELEDKQGIALALMGLGDIANRQGKVKTALACYQEGLALCREREDKGGIAHALGWIGTIAGQNNDPAGRDLIVESLALFQELGNTRRVAGTLLLLGRIQEALALFQELGDKQGISVALGGLAEKAQHRGEQAQAQALYEESLALCREIGNERGVAFALQSLGNMASSRGDFERARMLLGESVAHYLKLGDRMGLAWAYWHLGYTLLQSGHTMPSRAALIESLSLFAEMGNRAGTAYALDSFSCLALANEQPGRAARLLGAAMSLHDSLLVRRSAKSDLREMYADCLTAYPAYFCGKHTELEEETSILAWAEGYAMTQEQAIAYALEMMEEETV